jgi:hypothetical protein
MKKAIFSLLPLVILTSCQKTSNNNTQSNNSTNSTSSTNGSFFCAFNITDPSSSTSCYNSFDYSARIILPTPCTCGTKTGSAGTVSANGHSIAFVSSGSYPNYGIYTDAILNQYVVCPNPGQISGAVNWSIAGGNGISGFTYTTAKVMPVLPSFSYDTIHKLQSYTITHPTITADTITYSIGDNFFVGGLLTTKKTGSSSSVTFTAAQVQSMNLGTGIYWPATTRVNISANNISIHNGYTFVNNSSYSNDIKIVNN